MYQSVHYQPAASPGHMYLEQHKQQHNHHSLRTQVAATAYGRYPQQQQQQQQQQQHQQKPHALAPPALVLPPIIHTSNKSEQYRYQPHSPNSCYSSPTTSVPSDATVVDFPAKSPTPSCASTKTASPVPLAALAAVATAEHSQVCGSHTAPASPVTSARAIDNNDKDDENEGQQQPVRRRRGGRGSRSAYTAEEKEMRRKISHSAIEKRRRERTNNVLRDLQNMVPWLSKSNKVQKLEILEAAAQYIKELRTPHSADAVQGSPASSVATRVEDGLDDDDCGLDISDSPSSSAMKVNFLLS